MDSATAKELALTQYSSGADCVFVAAGPASVGVIEAGAESQKYVIGVDSDQALAYEGKDEANYIISSAIKGVGDSFSAPSREPRPESFLTASMRPLDLQKALWALLTTRSTTP